MKVCICSTDCSSISMLLGSLLLSSSLVSAQQRLDRFNYFGTEVRSDGWTDYGPEDWGDIECDETSVQGLENCLAYRDKWLTGRGWQIEDNYCRSCPATATTAVCGRHHQSPINLFRNVAIPGDADEHDCIDVHWMKYEDSFCSEEQLVNTNAFTVERHALRITQPISVDENRTIQIECSRPGFGRRFGRIDFSKGFSQYWFLSHIDIKSPSEHTQEGHRYSGEIQMHHFYSVTEEESGVANQVATVSVFLESYDDSPPYSFLDKLICHWRRNEYKVRTECGLAPITTDYPGCFPLGRNLRETTNTKPRRRRQEFQTVHDWIIYKDKHRNDPNITIPKLIMDDINWGPPEEKDWDAWIAEQSARMKAEDKLYAEIHAKSNSTDEAHQAFRRLIEGSDIEWFNYFPMLAVRTEYYYRYGGTQTIPPCYGTFLENTRGQTNHWRVLKDPIRIHPRQLQEIQRLLRERIAPSDALVNACQPDTAAEVFDDGSVSTARPLQYFHEAHFMTFCECKNWPSKWPEDRAWCEIEDYNERFYTHPYNYETAGY